LNPSWSRNFLSEFNSLTITNRHKSIICQGLTLDKYTCHIGWYTGIILTAIVNCYQSCLSFTYLHSLGLEISSVATPLTISDTVSIMCSTDLDVTTIKWIRDGITVASSSNQSLILLLDPVSADHHNSQYRCRVTTPYGTLEKTINITVQSKSLHLCILYSLLGKA